MIDKFKILISIIVICLLSSGFFIGEIYSMNDYNELAEKYNEVIITYDEKRIPKTEQDIIDDCDGLGLERSANCMVSNVRSFFKYGSVSQSGMIDFDVLKEKGGSCVSYSELYKYLAEELGFYSRTRITMFSENMTHMYAEISNSEGYCILDQRSYYCFDNFGEAII